MINISNSFVYDFRHLPPKYTISTLQSVDIADNQDSCGCIWKFTRFRKVKKERQVNAFQMSADPPALPLTGLPLCGLQCKITTFLRLIKN